MIHYIYKITCLCGELKDHYYYGKRSVKKMSHKYYGSGTILKKYYEKYPPVEGETIIKEIIEINNSGEENNKREIEIIGDLWFTDPLCLNLKPGGIGSLGCHASEETKKKMSASHKGRHIDKCIQNLISEKSISHRFVKGQIAHNKGIPMSEKQREKCSKSWFKGRKIEQLTLDGKHIKIWKSMQQVQNELGISKSSISLCCKGKQNKAGSFKWKYAA